MKYPENDKAELRHRAEVQLGDQGRADPVESPQRLFHELQVHQIELEMQNDDLQQTRRDLEASLANYSDLYDFAPVGYLTLDRKGFIRAVNLTGSSLIGVERSKLIGRHFGLILADQERLAFADFFDKIFASQTRESCLVQLQKEGHSEQCVQIEGMVAASGDECCIALIDNTKQMLAKKALRLEREKTELLRQANAETEKLRLSNAAAEALRLAKESAEESARVKSLFFANMSHELRTPMTGILGMLQLALDQDIAPKPRRYLENSLSSARSLLRILNDILDMSKIAAGKLIIEEEPFYLHMCITDIVDFFTPEVQSKGLELIVSVADDVPEIVNGDQGRLRQVLLNLIGNAIKFTEVGKIEVMITCGQALSDGKREFGFTVTDTGIGIPEDKKNLLFRTFSQLDDSHSRVYGGAGLGLAICSELVNLMGGTIAVESKPGTGSSFTFTIRLKEVIVETDTAAEVEVLSPDTLIAPAGDRIPHLLLGEDDPTIREILQEMLTRSNYVVDIAEDGRKLVEKWETGKYDLVLMDIQMPHLDGFEATRIIRERERESGGHTQIVAMTAHAGKEYEEKFLSAGMDAYTSKPIDFRACLQLIGETIRNNSAEHGEQKSGISV